MRRGGLYEAKDEEGQWWDVTVKEARADGTYCCHVHDGTKWEDGATGATWSRTYLGNMRRKKWLADDTYRLPGKPEGWTPASRDETKYDLYAVVNHAGNTGGGHYYAYIHSGGLWWNFNDSVVVEIRESDVVTREAYLLFYRRRDMRGTPLMLPELWPAVPPGKEPRDVEQIKRAKWTRPRPGTKDGKEDKEWCVVQ